MESSTVQPVTPISDIARQDQPSFYALAQHFVVLCTQLIKDNPPKGAPIWDVVAATCATTRELAATRRGRAGVPCITPGCTRGSCTVCEERDRLEARIVSLGFQLEAVGLEAVGLEAVGATLEPARCCGSEDEHGNPTCEGPDVQHVRVTTQSGATFETQYCAYCRAMAAGTVEITPPTQKIGRRVRYRRAWDGAEFSGTVRSDYPEHQAIGVWMDGSARESVVHLSNVLDWGNR